MGRKVRKKKGWAVQMWVDGMGWLYVRLDHLPHNSFDNNPIYRLHQDPTHDLIFEEAARYAKEIQKGTGKVVRIYCSKTGDFIPAAIL